MRISRRNLLKAAKTLFKKKNADLQQAPVATNETPIWDLVIEDMKARDHLGRQRYGVPLQASNSRDALQDAYEEALDLCAYLRQLIEIRKMEKK